MRFTQDGSHGTLRVSRYTVLLKAYRCGVILRTLSLTSNPALEAEQELVDVVDGGEVDRVLAVELELLGLVNERFEPGADAVAGGHQEGAELLELGFDLINIVLRHHRSCS